LRGSLVEGGKQTKWREKKPKGKLKKVDINQVQRMFKSDEKHF